MRHVLTLLTIFLCASPAMALDLGSLWNFGDPALSEQRFTAALQGATPDEQLILQTQIARTWGLRRDFDRARSVLDAIAARIPAASAEARTRFHLEFGRSYASPAHTPAQRTPAAREQARGHFTTAFEVARAARLDGLAVDALHMMVSVDEEPDQQLAWNERAVAYVEQSDQPKAKAWEGALRNNIGYAYKLKGDYEKALAAFRLSRAAHERAGSAAAVRVADWMIASVYRLQQRHDEALALQLDLERRCDAAGEPDPYVFEELVALYKAKGDDARAAHYEARLKAARP